MHVYDVEDAVEGVDPAGLHHAFRMMVAFPELGHIEGAHSADWLDRLFGDVISALQFDQTAMPDALVLALSAVTSLTFEPGASYAQGAVIASEFREKWQQRFVSEMAPRTAA